MVVKKEKAEKKAEKKSKSGGMSVEDAFADDEGVEYAESKPRKIKKKGIDDEELEEEIEEIEEKFEGKGEKETRVIVKASKPISKIKKGDKIKIDGNEYTVDGHYVLIDHGTTKEMAIELFDAKTDRDYQLRYFDDQAEATLDFYELQEILYVKRQMIKVEW